MLILNPKIQLLLRKQFLYTEEEVENMVIEYRLAILETLIDEIMVYIEKNNLTEKESSINNKLSQIKAMKQGDPKILENIYFEILNTVKEYPDLQKEIDIKIEALNEALNHEIVIALNDEGKKELLSIISDDLDEIEKSEKVATKILASQSAK